MPRAYASRKSSCYAHYACYINYINYTCYTNYTHYLQVRQDLGLADHVWQDKRTMIAQSVDNLGNQCPLVLPHVVRKSKILTNLKIMRIISIIRIIDTIRIIRIICIINRLSWGICPGHMPGAYESPSESPSAFTKSPDTRMY